MKVNIKVTTHYKYIAERRNNLAKFLFGKGNNSFVKRPT